MNILVDDIEQAVKDRIYNNIKEIEDDKTYFNTDFRIVILFELLMQDNEINQEAKIMQAINLFYPKPEQIKDIKKAVEDIMWFYCCGKETKATNGKEVSNKQIYSYEFDDEYIYSAFRDQYNINLQSIEYLHWWEFKAMFQSLKEDNLIVKIMGYRSINIAQIKDKEEKKFYKKMKKLYALPDMRTEEQKEADFGAAFW